MDQTPHEPQDMGKEQGMAAAFIEPDSGRVLKVLSDGSVVIQQGWNKHIHISGDTITVPPLTKVVAVSKTADVTKTDHASNMPAASEQGQHSHEDAPDALRHHDRHGSSQHVPELPPRAHSAPPRVSRAPCVAADPKHTGVHNGIIAKVGDVKESASTFADENKKHVDEASPPLDMNDQAAGELLLNFANSAAMSSATQAGITEPGLLTANKLCSSDQDTPQTKERSIPSSKAPAQQPGEGTSVGRSRQHSETQAPIASQVNVSNAPEIETSRLHDQLGAPQCTASAMQSTKIQTDAGAPKDEEARVREMAADMLVGSLVATIAQQAPAAELPRDNAMMTCLVSFSRACIGNTAPVEDELRAALHRCKQRARATLLPNQTLTAGAAARAMQRVVPGGAKKRGALPALAEAPPVSSGTPLAPVATGRDAPVNTAKHCAGENAAYPGTALLAATAAERQKRPATPNSHLQAPAKAACTSAQTAAGLSAEQMGNAQARRLSSAGEAGGGSDMKDIEALKALRASFQQNPEGVARLLLQSFDKQFPGSLQEATKGHNSFAAQPQQQSHTDVTSMRRAVLHQLLQSNPALVSQLAPAAVAAVEAAAPQEVAATVDARPPVAAQPVPPQSPNHFTAILMELQQCGASDQTIMHVLQTLMQQQHHTAPRAPAPQASAPQLSQALGSLGAASNAKLMAAHPSLLLAAAGHQPGLALPRGAATMSAGISAQMHAPQQPQAYPQAPQLQQPASSGGSQLHVSSLPLAGEVLRKHGALPSAGGANSVLTQTQLAQIISGLENYSRSQAASNQQQETVSGS